LSSESLLPSEFKSKVLELLRSNGVNVILGKRVTDGTSDNNPSLVTLSDGTSLSVDVVIKTISSAKPATSFLPKSVLDERGFVMVTDT
jgi:NAD(P)H-nitrite reductase large subunit